jgi:hypothetical protein
MLLDCKYINSYIVNHAVWQDINIKIICTEKCKFTKLCFSITYQT